MPVKKTSYFDMPAYQWGDDGTPHAYKPGNKASKERAKAAAVADGVIAKAKAKKAKKK